MDLWKLTKKNYQFLFFKEQTTHNLHVSNEINSSATVYIIRMWICSLGSVLWQRLVETGMSNDDLPSCFQNSGFDLDITMLFVAVSGLKLFTRLNCNNYFNVIYN